MSGKVSLQCFSFYQQVMPVAISSQSAPSSNSSSINGTKQPSHSARNSSLLPPELWAVVLSQLPSSELQHTALALSRAIPNAGVTLEVCLPHFLRAAEEEES